MVTIFTPTYNRAHLLTRLYDSLKKQTNKSFTWLIVDDGSTDDTKTLIARFKKENKININYYQQLRQGKHSAYNTGVKTCNTELFFCVDSDDMLVENAINLILVYYDKYKSENILGLFFRKVSLSNVISGSTYNLKQNLVGLRDLYNKHNYKGENAIIFITKKIKDVRFPVFSGEYFVSEKVLYNQLNSIALMAFIDLPIYIYEYQDEGYTKTAIKTAVKNPYGTALGFLTDSIHKKHIFAIKSYAAYNAWVYIFKLDIDLIPNLGYISGFVKCISSMVFPHYVGKFRSFRRKAMFNKLTEEHNK